MKILTVLHSHECGGAEIHALYVMEGLSERGHEVIFAGPEDSWIWEQVKQKNISAFSVPLHGTYDLYSIWKLCRFTKKNKPDVVHTHLVRGAFYGGIAARYAGVSCVSTVHNVNVHKHMSRAHRLIAVSNAVRDSLLKRGFKEEKITVVPNGIPVERNRDIEERREMRALLGLEDHERAVCMVARFAEQKGHDLMLKALRRINDSRLRLFFVGKEIGSWHEKIKHMVTDLGLAQKVTFVGHSENVMDILSAMDIFAAPSRREGLPLSLLEAMAAGLPVVASSVGGIPEVIRHGENGLLFEAEDEIALVRLLKQVIQDRDLAGRISSNARRTVQDEFSEKAMVRKTIAVYSEALGLN